MRFGVVPKKLLAPMVGQVHRAREETFPRAVRAGLAGRRVETPEGQESNRGKKGVLSA